MEGKLKVSAVQFHVTDGNIQANMVQVEKMATRICANEKDVDLILFHEACLESGTDQALIQEAETQQILNFWIELAKKCGTHILGGRLAFENGKLYNRATVFAPDGHILADYAKIHLYNSERDSLAAGDKMSVFTLNGMRIGIMICADFGFPELSRKYATSGKVDVLAVSSSWAYPDDDLWVLCNRTRAAENGIYVVSCDRTGPTSKGVVKVGRSMVCDPNGFVLSNLMEKEDTYYVQTIEKAEVEKRHRDMKWLEWIRPDVYAKM